MRIDLAVIGDALKACVGFTDNTNPLDLIVIKNSDTGISCRITRVSNIIYVAFRGTEFDKLNDIKTVINTNFTLYSLVNGRYSVRAHEGFFNAFDSIREQLYAVLNRDKEQTRIIYTGHSMGGAIAQIAHLDMADNYTLKSRHLISSITFGSPSVISHSNAISPEFIKSTLRVVNGCDPVPNLPFRFTGYSHIGREMLMTPFGLMDNPGFIKRFFFSILNIFKSHYLENYVKSFDALVKGKIKT